MISNTMSTIQFMGNKIMNTNKQKVILLVYSEGGHRSEMSRLLSHIEKTSCKKSNRISYISICETIIPI